MRKPESDPADPLSYSEPGLDKILEILRAHPADIITFQEAHTNSKAGQIGEIARALGCEFVNDAYDRSHLAPGESLSQGIISRFRMTEHHFELFLNPNLETIGPRGERWLSHDKGATSSVLELGNDLRLNVKTCHSVPLRKFRADPLSEKLKELREDMAKKLRPEGEHFLLQGDLNFDDYSLKPFLPGLFEAGTEEVIQNEPTTPKGRRYDHILYRGIKHIRSLVLADALTDHFPIYSEFEA